MTVCLYIFCNNDFGIYSLNVFEHTYVNPKHIYGKDSIKIVLKGDFYEKYDNEQIYNLIHKNVLWVAGVQGYPIETDILTFWFYERDDSAAKEIINNYRNKGGYTYANH